MFFPPQLGSTPRAQPQFFSSLLLTPSTPWTVPNHDESWKVGAPTMTFEHQWVRIVCIIDAIEITLIMVIILLYSNILHYFLLSLLLLLLFFFISLTLNSTAQDQPAFVTTILTVITVIQTRLKQLNHYSSLFIELKYPIVSSITVT